MDKKKIIGIVLGILLLVAVFHWLSNLVVYTLAAFLISMLGRPLVKLLHEKVKLPAALSSGIVLAVIIGIVGLAVWLVFPLFVRQAQQIASLDYNALSAQTTVMGGELIEWLNRKGVAVTGEDISAYFSSGLNAVWKHLDLQSLLGSLASKVSSLAIGLFCVIFLSFFFLRDEQMFKKMIFLFVPDRQTARMERVMKSVEHLLSRYFVGLSLEVICMMILLSLGLWLCGIENALLYGCLGGLFNVIPYLGPVIGATLTCLFAIVNHLHFGLSTELLWVLLKVVGVFTAANLIDNFVLQVTIYSNSVKAHPLEIFFVILIAGTLTGIWGMILAIPFYTVLRIIAKEFFKNTKLVRELTKRL
ncbi:MAG: AI-2E family transporter [Bacteroides sp.]|nr:AI-2E family transporter [Bacteroides sp.]